MKEIDKINKLKCRSEEDQKKHELIRGYCNKLNAIIEDGNIIFNKDNYPLIGIFAFDMTGKPGFGLKAKGKYQHLYGQMTNKKDEKDVPKFCIVESEESIHDFFKGIKYVKNDQFKTLS